MPRVVEFPVKDPVSWDGEGPTIRYMIGVGYAILDDRNNAIWERRVYNTFPLGTNKPFFTWRVKRIKRKAQRILKELNNG